MGIRLGTEIIDSDLEWTKERNAPYRYHVKLLHKPTGMTIEQASESAFCEAKTYCLKELQWRLKNWESYSQSMVRSLEV